MNTLIDPQITFCCFFVSPHRFEPPVAAKLDRERNAEEAEAEVVLAQLFAEAMSQLGGQRYPRPVFPAIVATSTERLGEPIQRQADGHEITAEIRTLHDTVCLRSQTLRAGRDFSADDFRTHPDPCPAALTGVTLPNYLGSLKLYSAEVARDATAEQLRQTADQIAGVVWEQPPLTCVASDEGVLILGRLDRQSEAIFVYREQTDVSTTMLLTLPELVLCHLKIRNAAHNLSIYLPAAKKHDHELRVLIDPKRPRRRKLKELRKVTDDITTQRSHLARDIARIEAEIGTLELNRQNFLTAVGSSGFANDAVALTDVMIDRWSTPLVAQANADLGYRIATRERAAVEVDSINTTTNWHDAQRTGWLTVIMLVLTLFQGIAGLLVIWQTFSGGTN